MSLLPESPSQWCSRPGAMVLTASGAQFDVFPLPECWGLHNCPCGCRLPTEPWAISDTPERTCPSVSLSWTQGSAGSATSKQQHSPLRVSWWLFQKVPSKGDKQSLLHNGDLHRTWGVHKSCSKNHASRDRPCPMFIWEHPPHSQPGSPSGSQGRIAASPPADTLHTTTSLTRHNHPRSRAHGQVHCLGSTLTEPARAREGGLVAWRDRERTEGRNVKKRVEESDTKL